MTTRKYPRTLEEAFGPGTSREIHEPDAFRWTPIRIALCITYALALVTLVCVL